MKIARVFPRRTSASPDDSLVFFTPPPRIGLPEIDEVHVSVAFTYDMQRAEDLVYQWETVGVPVKMGGPAFNEAGGEFIPGMYMKQGFTITSRGCPNKCWFCQVWHRENGLQELDIKDGWIIQDDNLLSCSDQHIKAVFEMLKTQKHRPIFSGGLEAKLLKPWHVELLREVNPSEMYFAYDTPDDYEPLVEAGKLLQGADFTLKSRKCMCYVLIGYKGDTFETAEKRLKDTIKAGFMPFAMLYKDKAGSENKEWRRFQREWANKTIVGSKIKEATNDK